MARTSRSARGDTPRARVGSDSWKAPRPRRRRRSSPSRRRSSPAQKRFGTLEVCRLVDVERLGVANDDRAPALSVQARAPQERVRAVDPECAARIVDRREILRDVVLAVKRIAEKRASLAGVVDADHPFGML